MHSQRRSISIRKYGQHLTFFERFHHVGYCLFLYPLYLRKSHDAPGLRNLFPAPKSGHIGVATRLKWESGLER